MKPWVFKLDGLFCLTSNGSDVELPLSEFGVDEISNGMTVVDKIVGSTESSDDFLSVLRMDLDKAPKKQ